MIARILKAIGIIIVAFSLGAVLSYIAVIYRPPKSSTGAITVTIQKGEGPRVIAQKLRVAKLLDNERPFYVYILLTGKRNKFYPGTYELDDKQSLKQMIDTLTTGKEAQYAVTVIEGWRITDIAKEVAKKTKVTETDFLTAAPVSTYEGYLFPDTYFFSPTTTADQIVKVMRSNFDKRTAGLSLTNDDVILASIIEREAKTDTDRANIAGLYLNRLKVDMALQADPTVQYAKGDWGPIRLADYTTVQSAYNTYLNKGLPPTPIANPGLASLKAVKSPAKHDFYYFFHTSDGKTIYSKTLEEHNTNKAQYLR